MKALKVPTYGHHKPIGQARYYVAGKSVYLGKYGSEESRIRFGEIVAKVVSGVPVDPFATTSADPAAALTMNELVLASCDMPVRTTSRMVNPLQRCIASELP